MERGDSDMRSVTTSSANNSAAVAAFASGAFGTANMDSLLALTSTGTTFASALWEGPIYVKGPTGETWTLACSGTDTVGDVKVRAIKNVFSISVTLL